MSHTEGPWRLAPNNIPMVLTGTYLMVADTYCNGVFSDEEQMANARLIAAAPDLLALCTEMLGLMRHAQEMTDRGEEIVGMAWEGVIKRAEEAVKKAKVAL